MIFTIPILFALMHPREDEVKTISEEKVKQITREIPKVDRPDNPTLAERIDHSYLINIIFGLMGLIYIV